MGSRSERQQSKALSRPSVRLVRSSDHWIATRRNRRPPIQLQALAELGAATTHRIKAGSRAKLPRPAEAHEDLPPDHVEGHREVLGARAGVRMLAAWQTAVTECTVLRCGHLIGRVERAEPKPPRLIGPLTDVLDGRLADSDTAGAATVLAALVPLLDHLPPRQGRLGKREALLRWAGARASLLTALGRCSVDDGCPACRAGEPCALELWPETFAQLALGDPDRYARGFFEMTGKEAGTGAYTSWLGRGVDQRVCDAALWRCVEHWRAVEMFKRAEQVIELGWAAGCRHPDLTDAYAGQLAASGRLASYERAIEVCDEALGGADGSTHPGWARKRSRRNQLAGRRQRLVLRPSGEFDEDGNPIPARRHHPARPRRIRPMRFVDAGPVGGLTQRETNP